MSEKPESVGVTVKRERRGKRRVVVELYRRAEGGRLVPQGTVVTEYDGDRRGGAVRELSRDR